jgi:hypothetical protein
MSSPAGWSTSSLSSVPEPERTSHPDALKSSPRLPAPLSRIWRGDYAGPFYRKGFGLLLSALMMVAVACGGDDKAPVATQVPATAATPEARTPIGVPPVQPTVGQTTAPVTGGEVVAFQSPDGAVTMRGNLYVAPGPKRKALIIASQLPDTEAAWQPFAKELAGAGIATLTFQMPQYRDAGGQRDYTLMDRDLEASVLFLESRDYPLVYLLGDITAGTAAIKVAARRKVAGVITVASPPGFGIPGSPSYDARPDLSKVNVPKLFLAPQEQSAAVQELMKAPDPKQSKLFAGPPSGIAMMNGPEGAAFKQTIRDFVLK